MKSCVKSVAVNFIMIPPMVRKLTSIEMWTRRNNKIIDAVFKYQKKLIVSGQNLNPRNTHGLGTKP